MDDEKIWAAILGAVFGFIGGVARGWFESRDRVDQHLREKRLKVYAPLWKLTREIPQYPRAEKLSGKTLDTLSKSVRSWYFGEESPDAVPGGIFLSAGGRHAYGKAQEALLKAAGKFRERTIEPYKPEPDGCNYDSIQKPLSRLRTELTRDLVSRRRGVWSSRHAFWRRVSSKAAEQLGP